MIYLDRASVREIEDVFDEIVGIVDIVKLIVILLVCIRCVRELGLLRELGYRRQFSIGLFDSVEDALCTYDLLPVFVIGKTFWTGREVYESDLAKGCITDGWAVQLCGLLTVNGLARPGLALPGRAAARERRHALHRLTPRRHESHAQRPRSLTAHPVASGSTCGADPGNSGLSDQFRFFRSMMLLHEKFSDREPKKIKNKTKKIAKTIFYSADLRSDAAV